MAINKTREVTQQNIQNVWQAKEKKTSRSERVITKQKVQNV